MLRKLFDALFSIGNYEKATKEYLSAKKAYDETRVSNAVSDIRRWLKIYANFYARSLDGESFVDDDGDDLLELAEQYIVEAMSLLGISTLSAGNFIGYDGRVIDDESQGYHGITILWGVDIVNKKLKLHEPYLTKQNHVKDNYVTDNVYAYYVDMGKVIKKFMTKEKFWKYFENRVGFEVDYFEKLE